MEPCSGSWTSGIQKENWQDGWKNWAHTTWTSSIDRADNTGMQTHLKDGVLYRRWESHCGKEVTWHTASSGPPRPNQKWSTTIGWSRTQATTTQLGFFHLLGMTSTSKVADQGPRRTHRLRTSSVGNQGPWWTLRLRTSSVGNQGPWWTQTPDEQRGEPGALVDSQSSRSAPSQVSARPRRGVRPLKWTRDFVLNT